MVTPKSLDKEEEEREEFESAWRQGWEAGFRAAINTLREAFWKPEKESYEDIHGRRKRR